MSGTGPEAGGGVEGFRARLGVEEHLRVTGLASRGDGQVEQGPPQAPTPVLAEHGDATDLSRGQEPGRTHGEPLARAHHEVLGLLVATVVLERGGHGLLPDEHGLAHGPQVVLLAAPVRSDRQSIIALLRGT